MRKGLEVGRSIVPCVPFWSSSSGSCNDCSRIGTSPVPPGISMGVVCGEGGRGVRGVVGVLLR